MQIENETSAYDNPLGALCELHNYDSVSMRSSVVDSEFVASQIRRFEAQNHEQVPYEQNNNQINLQISVISKLNLIE